MYDTVHIAHFGRDVRSIAHITLVSRVMRNSNVVQSQLPYLELFELEGHSSLVSRPSSLPHPLQERHQLLVATGRGPPVHLNQRCVLSHQTLGERLQANIDGSQGLIRN